MSKRKVSANAITRREMLKGTGLVLGGLAVPGLLEACLSSGPSSSGPSIKIGFVSPITGPASGFGEPDGYVLGLARKAFQSGITIGGTNYSVEIVQRDGQSTPSVGTQVAQDLIQSQKVDLMLTTSTPETVNPVSAACEASGVPCISSVVPWQAWYLGLGGKIGQSTTFKFAYHYCFGVEQFFKKDATQTDHFSGVGYRVQYDYIIRSGDRESFSRVSAGIVYRLLKTH